MEKHNDEEINMIINSIFRGEYHNLEGILSYINVGGKPVRIEKSDLPPEVSVLYSLKDLEINLEGKALHLKKGDIVLLDKKHLKVLKERYENFFKEVEIGK